MTVAVLMLSLTIVGILLKSKTCFWAGLTNCMSGVNFNQGVMATL